MSSVVKGKPNPFQKTEEKESLINPYLEYAFSQINLSTLIWVSHFWWAPYGPYAMSAWLSSQGKGGHFELIQ